MAPKVPEKQHTQQQANHHPQALPNNAVAIKHSNPFHISAVTLCHNKRLKLKRSKYGEYLRNAKNRAASQKHSNNKTEERRQRLSLLQADVTIDLLSDDEGPEKAQQQPSVIVYPERMCLERAAILGLMPVERLKNPPPLVPILPNYSGTMQLPIAQPTKTKVSQQKQHQIMQPVLMIPLPPQKPSQQQPRKRKSRPQKRRSLQAPLKTPILINSESIVLSDDSNDGYMTMPPPAHSMFSMSMLEPPELTVTCPTSSQIPCLPLQNTMQVDEEVTISLVPRSLNANTCASLTALNSADNATTPHQEVFPMLPDETTVHTVIANRIYELSLTKLREGLASCGIPEFAADGQQKISPQRRKGMVHQPPVVSPPQAPISLKLSSDLSISLISDDEDETRQRSRYQHEPILSPAFLQKLPVNVSIAPVPMRPPPTTTNNSNHTTEPRKLKLG